LAVPRDLLAAGLDAGDVYGSLDPEPLDALDDLDRRLARLAASSCDGDERRGQGPQRLERTQQRYLALRRAGREKLEGDQRGSAAEQLLDLHAVALSGRALLLQCLHSLVLAVVVPRGHRHEQRIHAAIALAPQDTQPLV